MTEEKFVIAPTASKTKPMNTLNVEAHAQSVIARGYTVIPSQVGANQIAALNQAADRALEAVSRAMAAGLKPAHTEVNPYVRSARCAYTWDQSCRDLLGHDTVHALAKAVLGEARLWDMTILEALPMPHGADLGSFNWHRDFTASSKHGHQAYLWVFTCLTDVTEDNGATWVIPGSHRDPSNTVPRQATVSDPRPSDAVQLTARAGDIVAINPVMFHRVGENRTQCGRRLALVGMCRSDRPPLLNHWSIAGPAVRRQVPDHVRRILHTTDPTVAESWDVLPEGWAVAKTSSVKRAFLGLYRRGGAGLSDPSRIWRRLRREANP